MYAVAKAAGSKKLQSPTDIMRIPLIDGQEAGNVRHHLVERLRAFNKEKYGKDT